MRCGENFDEMVRDWAKSVHTNNEIERHLRAEGDIDGMKSYNEIRLNMGYQLPMDHMDLVVHAPQPTRTNFGHDYYMAHVIAIPKSGLRITPE